MLKYKSIQALMFLLLVTITATAQNEKKGGHISMQILNNDTMHVITATVTDSVSGQPLGNVELTFYVQRFFGLIKVGEGTTDTTGVATAEFARDIRADQNGKVMLIAKIEDNDAINDVAIQMILKPDFTYIKNKPLQRAMIGRYAPWWLVITFVLIVGTVCLLFAYVLYIVYLIKKAATKKIIPHLN